MTDGQMRQMPGDTAFMAKGQCRGQRPAPVLRIVPRPKANLRVPVTNLRLTNRRIAVYWLSYRGCSSSPQGYTEPHKSVVEQQEAGVPGGVFICAIARTDDSRLEKGAANAICGRESPSHLCFAKTRNRLVFLLTFWGGIEMAILQRYPIFIAGSLPHPLPIYRESLRDPATCVRAGPGCAWQRHDGRLSSRTRTAAAPRAPCP